MKAVPKHDWFKPGPRQGADSTAAAFARVTLDGSGSMDPNGDTLTFKWRQVGGPLVDLQEARSPKPWFIPTEQGVHTFELIVSDGLAESAPATVEVSVVRKNRPPVPRRGC